MKRNYYDIARDKAFRAHSKAEALRFLLESHQSAGSCVRDVDAFSGIGYILEEISNDARAVNDMLDCGTLPPLDTEVEVSEMSKYGYPLLPTEIAHLRTSK